MNRLPRGIFVLGVVSFLTDLSSDMIYPLLPVFLSGTLGAGALALGIIEGVAESTASFLKIVSGFWTDRVNRRRPFIVFGYGISGLVRPLIAFAATWPFVLMMRFGDRIGKGLRTAPRDALIADITEPGQRGKAYGFHRSMDHAGAVVGPLVAAGLMGAMALSIREVFLLAAIPAVLVILILIFFLKEPAVKGAQAPIPPRLQSHWKDLRASYKTFLRHLFRAHRAIGKSVCRCLRAGESQRHGFRILSFHRGARRASRQSRFWTSVARLRREGRLPYRRRPCHSSSHSALANLLP